MIISIISTLVKKKTWTLFFIPLGLHAQTTSAEYFSNEGSSNQWVYVNFYNHQLVRKTFNADFKLKQCTTKNTDSYIENLQSSQANCALVVNPLTDIEQAKNIALKSAQTEMMKKGVSKDLEISKKWEMKTVLGPVVKGKVNVITLQNSQGHKIYFRHKDECQTQVKEIIKLYQLPRCSDLPPDPKDLIK